MKKAFPKKPSGKGGGPAHGTVCWDQEAWPQLYRRSRAYVRLLAAGNGRQADRLVRRGRIEKWVRK